MVNKLLIFDMDGVLVDVNSSYREAIVRTVEYFTGHRVSHESIQAYKNQGGWNDDWMLSQRMCADLGVSVDLDTVTERFNRFFFGEDGQDGLIKNERWIAEPGLLERLSERYKLGIFTGRHDFEVAPTLERFAAGFCFDPVITANCVKELKPSPEGLLQIMAAHPGAEIWYVGDTVDDALAAKAAKVRFIGIAEPGKPRYEEVCALLKEHGATAVLDDINQLERVL